MASNDPTDTGGLFVGRRPGTAPVRYRDVEPSSERRRRMDASLMLTMAAAKRIDHAWKLVRRAAGHRQDRGALERIFASCVGVALVAFAIWFLIIQGPGPSLAP